MSGCVPCDIAAAKQARFDANMIVAREYQRANNIESLVIVEVVRSSDGFNEGDYHYCLANDIRLQTIFHEVNTILL